MHAPKGEIVRAGPDFSMRRAFHIALDAYWRFLADDGWAIASHIALSALMAMFPFFIVLTSLAGFFGSSDLADEVAKLMLATWPDEVAGPIAREIQNVLTTTHPGALTLGARVENVTDAAYAPLQGYPMPGRHLRLRLAYARGDG